MKERQNASIAAQNLLITKVLEYLTYKTILDHHAENFHQILIVNPFSQKVSSVDVRNFVLDPKLVRDFD